jgi:hypothetical protein
MINGTGPLNAHLAFTPEPGRYDRATPLPRETPVFGAFLSLTYDGHWPSLVLTEHSGRADLAEYAIDWVLLGCEVIAIENGKRLGYTITYDDANGPRRYYHPNKPTPGLVWNACPVVPGQPSRRIEEYDRS